MQTNKLPVKNTNIRLPAAMKITDDVAMRLGLSRKDWLHLQLLVEETLGMVRAMTDGFEGKFWLEYEGRICYICLEVETDMDRDRKDQLIALSTSGENASRKGFMGKIADIIENSLLFYDDVGKMEAKYGAQVVPAEVNFAGAGEESMIILVWSLNGYRQNLVPGEERAENREAWDELEKSIVAKLSDDVIVGIKKKKASFTIVKNFE